MVSDLCPRPGPCHYHNISPSSTQGSVDKIVISASVTSPSVTTTLAIANKSVRSKPQVSITKLFQGDMDGV